MIGMGGWGGIEEEELEETMFDVLLWGHICSTKQRVIDKDMFTSSNYPFH